MADLKLKDLEEQLKRIGCNFQFWGRSELRELANVLFPGEIVEHCVNGSYEGGFALLAATDQRVLLIDKKPMYLTLEDIRFDMIAEVDYNHRLMNATIFVRTPNKSLRFTGYNHTRLRKLFHFVQTRVMEIRQHYQHQGQVWKEYAESLQAGQPIEPAQATQPVQYEAVPVGSVQNIPSQASPQQPTQQSVGQTQPVSQAPQAPQATQVAPAQSSVPATPPSFFPSPPPLGMHTVAPIISAYTRLPLLSRQRRFLGSRAMNMSLPSTASLDTSV